MTDKNLERGILLLFGIIIISLSFVFAAHTVFITSGGTSFNFKEDLTAQYNITINNTDPGQAANITQVNITLPSGLIIFTENSNKTNSPWISFTNTSNVLSWTNSTVYLINGSTNATWFSFNATAPTPGVYNISIKTVNATGSFITNISVRINDTTAPTAISFVSPGAISGMNLSYNYAIPINASVIDNGVVSTINITLYNSTFTAINSSMNSSNVSSWFFNFTGANLIDGVYIINVTANDTYGYQINQSINITLDATKPVITFSCSPTTLTKSGVVTCTCNATDATSGLLANSPEFNVNPPVEYGTQTTTCTARDYAGNNITSSIDYVVSGGAPAPSSGGSTVNTYTKTYIPSDAEFKEGYVSELKSNERVKLTIDSKTHYVGVTGLTTTSATITIASTPQTATLAIGEEKKFDVTADGYYDLSVKLNSITSGKASLTVKSIYEKISAAVVSETPTAEPTATTATPTGEVASTSGKSWIWIGVIVIIIIVLIWIGYSQYKKRK